MSLRNKIAFVLSIIATILVVIIACILIFKEIPNYYEQKELKEQIKEYYDNKLSIYEEENNNFADYEVDVAFLGDSLTDGYDLKKYFPEFVVSNRGIGGETTIGLENRMKVSVYDLKPKVVVLLIGGNNLDTMFDNYENLLIGLQENLPNTEVVLLSLTAMGREWAYKNEIACYNNIKIKKLAEKYNYTFIDTFTPLFNIETGEIYNHYTNDGVHFTDEGYELITSLVKPVLTDLLKNN